MLILCAGMFLDLIFQGEKVSHLSYIIGITIEYPLVWLFWMYLMVDK